MLDFRDIHSTVFRCMEQSFSLDLISKSWRNSINSKALQIDDIIFIIYKNLHNLHSYFIGIHFCEIVNVNELYINVKYISYIHLDLLDMWI